MAISCQTPVFVQAVFLRAFDFQSQPQQKNE